jgi:hypothetical protein
MGACLESQVLDQTGLVGDRNHDHIVVVVEGNSRRIVVVGGTLGVGMEIGRGERMVLAATEVRVEMNS